MSKGGIRCDERVVPVEEGELPLVGVGEVWEDRAVRPSSPTMPTGVRRRSPRAALLCACLGTALLHTPTARAAEPEGRAERDHAAKPMAAGRLAPSGPWETEYYQLRASAPGPTVLVLAGQHGDEPAGPLAADRLLGWRLSRGTLFVVPRVNRPALAARTRLIPGVRDPDLARNFPRAEGEAPRGPLAAALWAWLESNRPDLIVDYHEGFDFHRRGGKSLGSSVLFTPAPVAEQLVPPLLAAVNGTISTPSKQFDPIPKPIVGSVIDAAWKRLGIAGIVLETTKAAQPLALRVEQHLCMTAALLDALGMRPVGVGAER